MWNAFVNVKFSDWNDDSWKFLKSHSDVESMWSRQGEWDATLKLVSSVDLNKLEEFIESIRSQNWIKDTCSWWARAM